MNKYTEYHRNNVAERDFIFAATLENFNNKPINILEIGTSRDLNFQAKHGDGWSILAWGEYAAKTNSHITVVELDPQALENCKIISEDFKDYITYINGCGIEYLKQNKDKVFDLVYLDGPDSNEITVQMFEECNRKNSWILVDDFLPKGKADTLKVKYPDYELFQCKNCSHQLGLYHPQK